MNALRALVLVVGVLAGGAVARARADADRSLSPYFFVEGGDPDVDRLPLESTTVEVDVAGVIANVVVRQTYVNRGRRPIHARYVFPASTRAAVHGLKMTVGDVAIHARVKERASARAEFEKVKSEGKSATLLEQDRPNVFTMNVANVMPGDRIQVELAYTELLVPTEGVYEFVYPTVVGPRYASASTPGGPHDSFVSTPYLHAGEPATSKFSLEAQIESPIPIQELAVPSHAVQPVWNGRHDARVRVDAPGDRDVILRWRLAGSQIQSGLMLYKGASENFFLLMVEPPARVAPAQIPPREYVFIVDVSGSMEGFPLDTSKELLKNLVGGLRPTDTFNVILFAGAHRLMAPRSVPATKANIAAALELIGHQRGGGDTELLPALETAMTLPTTGNVARSLVVITDGYIATEKEVFQVIRKNLGRANVFSFGIGSSVNRYLVDGVAKAGLGESFVVTDPSQAAATAARFRAYVDRPVLTDIEVKYDGFRAYDIEPLAVPDLMAGRPIVVHGKWAGDTVGKILITGAGGQGPYRAEVDVGSAPVSKTNHALAYLWARTRIAMLSDFSFGVETPEEKEEITSLGLAYNLLTRHTSFIAVYERVRNASGDAEEVAQPLPMPAGVSDLAVGMEAGSEPGLLSVLAIFALVALMGFAARSYRRWRRGV